MEHHTAESREPRGVEEASCTIFSSAPTVSQTIGIDENEGEQLLYLAFSNNHPAE